MKKKLSIFFFWFLSLILTSIYIHENPELIEEVKKNLKDDKILVFAVEEDTLTTPGNSFILGTIIVLLDVIDFPQTPSIFIGLHGI